jgi:hypothetical protein
VFHGKNIGEQSGMSAISVRERMDLSDQAVMKANRNFIHAKGFVIDPVLSIS